MGLDVMQPQTCGAARVSFFDPWTRQHDKFHQCRQRLDVPPVVDLLGLVCANDPEQTILWKLLPERPGGIDGEARASLIEFKRRHFERRMTGDRGLHQRGSLRPGKIFYRPLQRRSGGGHKQHLFERHLLHGILRGDQVP